MGDGENADIRSSSVQADSISGTDKVGGLVGSGQNAIIISSYVRSSEVEGKFDVGGLVGNGMNVSISSSYVESGAVNGTSGIGGIIGSGLSVGIYSSYVQTSAVNGSFNVGGLVGNGMNVSISSSYVQVISVGRDSASNVGGLVGNGDDADIRFSYAQTGDIQGSSQISGLVGNGENILIHISYWNTRERREEERAREGDYFKLALEIATQLMFENQNPVSQYCDRDGSGNISSDQMIWNYGFTIDNYPAITCAPNGVKPQRNWWMLNKVNFLALNSMTDDSDNDGVPDDADLDDDGDGLIEINSLAMFNNIRYVLNGSGYKDGDLSVTSFSGCSGDCKGYELTRDIYLGSLDWMPIGGPGCESSPFAAIFEGNNHRIYSLNIFLPEESCVGLFASLESDAVIKNVHLHPRRINGANNTGGLVGLARGGSH